MYHDAMAMAAWELSAEQLFEAVLGFSGRRIEACLRMAAVKTLHHT